jgi:hypothetical protein
MTKRDVVMMVVMAETLAVLRRPHDDRTAIVELIDCGFRGRDISNLLDEAKRLAGVLLSGEHGAFAAEVDRLTAEAEEGP